MSRGPNGPELASDAELLAFDRAHVWPPYGRSPNDEPRYCAVSTHGVRIRLRDGRELIDGMSSWWSAIFGYGRPELHAAAMAQLGAMPHVMFGGLTHPPAVELARALLERAPRGLEHVFFCDSGSVSVEVALKMARQHFMVRRPGAPPPKVLALRGGYHGDTWGALGVCDPDLSMRRMYADALPPALFAPRPAARFGEVPNPAELAALGALVERHAGELCAVILEPIAQGAGGMHFYSPSYLKELRRRCDETGVLLIADEIATGFGRTGKLFACEHAGVRPDILCIGKALTGGTLSFAATLTTPAVAEAIAQSPPGRFMHGPTFMGNPLACAVALETLRLLDTLDWRSQVARVESRLQSGLAPCAALPAVARVSVLGAVGVVEMRHPLEVSRVVPRLVDQGVWLRPFGRLLYTMPPYVTDDADLDRICSAMQRIAEAP